MTSRILAIFRYTFLANLRSRIFLILLLFGALLLSASVLLSLLGQEQEVRLFLDLGLGASEILTFLLAIALVSGIVVEEIESRTLYLVLTRSLSRTEYILGKFFGILFSLGICYALMIAAHAALLFLKGWQPGSEGRLYALAVFLSFEKIVLIAALALFFALFSSSAIVALVFTIFFWVLGHFGMELRFLAGKIEPSSLRAFFKGIVLLLPQFQYMNARDLWVAVQDRIPEILWKGFLYASSYTAACLALSAALFKRKEF